MMQDKRKKIECMPGEIFSLTVKAYYSIPVPFRYVQELKERFPEYWNKLGEFDPYFKHRNRFLNFFRWYILQWKSWRLNRPWRKAFKEILKS